MHCFIKSFIVVFLLQGLLVGITFPIKPIRWIGEIFAYTFYIMPIVIFAPNTTGEEQEVSSFFLFGLPMIIWSIVIGLGVCAIQRLFSRRKQGIQQHYRDIARVREIAGLK